MAMWNFEMVFLIPVHLLPTTVPHVSYLSSEDDQLVSYLVFVVRPALKLSSFLRKTIIWPVLGFYFLSIQIHWLLQCKNCTWSFIIQLINTLIILFMSCLFPTSLLWKKKEGQVSHSWTNCFLFILFMVISDQTCYRRLYYTEQHCHRAWRLIQVNILLWRPRKSICYLPRTDLIWSPAQNNVIMAHQKSCKKVTDRSLSHYISLYYCHLEDVFTTDSS